MAIWKDQPAGKPGNAPAPAPAASAEPTPIRPNEFGEAARNTAPARSPELKESVIASELTIEGKIEGAGQVVIAGEVEGNIESAKQVELLASGSLTGDIKAGSLTVAPGARMRGQADFGWEEKAKAPSSSAKAESALG